MIERLAHTAASRLLPLRGYAGSAGENWRLTGQGLCRVEGHDNRRHAAGSGRRSALLQFRALIDSNAGAAAEEEAITSVLYESPPVLPDIRLDEFAQMSLEALVAPEAGIAS